MQNDEISLQDGMPDLDGEEQKPEGHELRLLLKAKLEP